jgi:hypothetical protein
VLQATADLIRNGGVEAVRHRRALPLQAPSKFRAEGLEDRTELTALL